MNFSTLYAFTVYIKEIVTSNTELVINAVVILVIMDLYEHLYSGLKANTSRWLDDNDSCVKSFPAHPRSVTVEEVAPVEEATPLEDATSMEEATPVDARVGTVSRINMVISCSCII